MTYQIIMIRMVHMIYDHWVLIIYHTSLRMCNVYCL